MPDATLEELYREILLDHYRNPRHRGALDGANRHADGSNPRAISGNLDRPISGMIWARDNSGVYFGAESEGSKNLMFASTTGAVRAINEHSNTCLQGRIYAKIKHRGHTVAVELVSTRCGCYTRAGTAASTPHAGQRASSRISDHGHP
mgnify:CR=1 FL=1